jgi:hypothetical protein
MDKLPPLKIDGVPFGNPQNRFVMVWPSGTVNDFTTWEALRAFVKTELQSANLDALKGKFFIYQNGAWAQVPRPS